MAAWVGVPGRYLGLLILLALVVRLGFLLAVSHPEVLDGAFVLQESTDEAEYHALASELARSGVYRLSSDAPPTAKRPPGLVLPVAALYAVFGPAPVLAVGYVLLCSLAVVPVAGALAWASSRRRWASVLAMGLAALLPTLVFTASGLWSEPPALLFTLVSLLLLVRSEGRFDRVGTAALAGLALAAGYLNRPSVGLVIALVFAWLVVDGFFVTRGRGSKHWREALSRAAVFALVAALPILAWGARNQRALGGFYLGNTESTAALWGSNNPVTAGLEPPALARSGGYDLEREAAEGRYLGSWVPLSYLEGEAPARPGGAAELERHRRQQRRVRELVLEHPWAWLRLLGYKGWRILTAEPMAPSILGEDPGMRRLKRVVTFAERWLVLLAGGYGMALLARRRPRHALLYGIYAAAGLAVVFLAYPNARIFLPVSVALLPPAAVALAELGDRTAFLPPLPGRVRRVGGERGARGVRVSGERGEK